MNSVQYSNDFKCIFKIVTNMSSRGGARNGAGRPKGQGSYGEKTKPIRLPLSMVSKVMKFVNNQGYQLPLYSSKVQAGIPAPADDYLESKLDLNEYLIRHPTATFLVRVAGDSMIDVGIHEDDMLVVDKCITPGDGKIVVVAVDGQLTVKRLKYIDKKVYLVAENKNYPPIKIRSANDLHIWGVVTSVIHKL